MAFRFKKHYSVEEARELIPQLRLWIDELNQNRKQVEQLDQRLGQLLTSGCDAGGEMVNNWIKSLAGIQKVLAYLRELDIQLNRIAAIDAVTMDAHGRCIHTLYLDLV
jgi:hypothetical protein